MLAGLAHRGLEVDLGLLVCSCLLVEATLHCTMPTTRPEATGHDPVDVVVVHLQAIIHPRNGDSYR